MASKHSICRQNTIVVRTELLFLGAFVAPQPSLAKRRKEECPERGAGQHRLVR
jgi:hypothetical protein